MAATTYASLVSLMNVLTRYQHPTCPVPFDQSHIQTLLDKVSSLVEFLEIYYDSQTKTNRGSIQDLEKQMTRAARAAEDMIEFYYVKLMLARDAGDSNVGYTWPDDIILYPDLQKSIQEMDIMINVAIDFVNKEKKHEKFCIQETYSITSFLHQCNGSTNIASLEEEHGSETTDPLELTPILQEEISIVEFAPNLNDIANTNILATVSSLSHPRAKNVMVGFADQLTRLMDRIRIHNPSRVIIPIVGMGGMGKTTLAKNVYNHSYVGCHFDIRAWVTISQHYVVKDIIICLLEDIKVGGNDQMDDEQLGDKLYKGLCGRKYLIVLDDVWSSEAWDGIRRFFPDNANGSRVLLTTRLHGVALRVGSSSCYYEMEFLSDDKSFSLLRERVYGLEVFPHKLHTLGKEIAKRCKGLPLAIVVVSGLLKMSPKTVEFWSNVANNVSSIISTENNGHCLEILSLSYDHLPIHLKPCFLYMATFKEDETIWVPSLIKLWVADGLLRPIKNSILEEVAFEYINDLIARNLIMARVKNEIGKLMRCSVHDVVREFCLRQAQHEKFLCLIEENTLPQRLERRLVYNSSNYKVHSLFSLAPNARSLYFGYSKNSIELPSDYALLRVLCIQCGFKMPSDFAHLFNIRYLECRSLNSLHPDSFLLLSSFWNLETLIIYDSDYRGSLVYLPREIWGLPNLRHLEVTLAAIFPDPRPGKFNCVLNNLQTIKTHTNFYFTDVAVILIPNLKELSFRYNTSVHVVKDPKLSRSFVNLALLDKLEKLSVSFFFGREYVKGTLHKPESLIFSPNLRELTLERCGIPWDTMTDTVKL